MDTVVDAVAAAAMVVIVVATVVTATAAVVMAGKSFDDFSFRCVLFLAAKLFLSCDVCVCGYISLPYQSAFHFHVTPHTDPSSRRSNGYSNGQNGYGGGQGGFGGGYGGQGGGDRMSNLGAGLQKQEWGKLKTRA